MTPHHVAYAQLDALHLTTAFQTNLGYVISDVCAKYLLLFVYISHVNA